MTPESRISGAREEEILSKEAVDRIPIVRSSSQGTNVLKSCSYL
jgi:hypothetical protein